VAFGDETYKLNPSFYRLLRVEIIMQSKTIIANFMSFCSEHILGDKLRKDVIFKVILISRCLTNYIFGEIINLNIESQNKDKKIICEVDIGK
jgi:hypothetical protein